MAALHIQQGQRGPGAVITPLRSPLVLEPPYKITHGVPTGPQHPLPVPSPAAFPAVPPEGAAQPTQTPSHARCPPAHRHGAAPRYHAFIHQESCGDQAGGMQHAGLSTSRCLHGWVPSGVGEPAGGGYRAWGPPWEDPKGSGSVPPLPQEQGAQA